jgi:PTS system nitrogen regulatory IIA component
MNLELLIKPESVLCNAQARSKKHCIEILSELLVRSAPGLLQEEIFSALISRERLGSTGFENGIAFPRCRADGIQHTVGAFMKLLSPVDFDAPDGEPVDLIFGLIVPQDLAEHHCSDLDDVRVILDNHALATSLRKTNSSTTLYKALQQALITPSQLSTDVA